MADPVRTPLQPGSPRALSRPQGRLPDNSLIQAYPLAMTTYGDLAQLARAIHQLRGKRPWRLRGAVGDYNGHLTTAIVQVYLDDPDTQDEQWLCAAVVDGARPARSDGSRRDVDLLHDALFRAAPVAEQRRLDPARAPAAQPRRSHAA